MKYVFLALFLAFSLDAQRGFPTVNDEIMKVEETYRVAKLNRDINTLNLILAEGFNETNQNGNSRNKTETLDLWRTFVIESLTTDSYEVRVSASTAMVLGTQTENGYEHMLFTRVYVKGRDGWKLFASMQYRNPKLPSL